LIQRHASGSDDHHVCVSQLAGLGPPGASDTRTLGWVTLHPAGQHLRRPITFGSVRWVRAVTVAADCVPSSASLWAFARGQHGGHDPERSDTLQRRYPQRRPAVLMDMARLQANVNIGRGAAKACAIDPAFIDKAGVHILRYLRTNGTSSGEMLTDSCKLAGIKSTDDRHFGAVFRSLIRLGLIRWAGDARRVKGHASRGGSLYQEVIR